MRAPFILENIEVLPGTEKVISLELPNFYHAPVTIPVRVIHGKTSGPTAFVLAAIHGDELNGIEIIRRLRKVKILKRLHGTLILVPLVNIYGVMTQSRYLPDRRDLNRSFPGSAKGSLAARVADTLFKKIISYADFGIDLHTGAIHRSNLPQVRVNTKDTKALEIAEVFEAPVILHSPLREGSLRETADQNNIPIVLYEAGEALRFDEKAIRIGVKGIINILRTQKMLPPNPRKKPFKKSILTVESKWLRSPQSGLIRTVKSLGDTIEEGDVLALIDDPLTDDNTEIKSTLKGIIIGRTQIPLVQEGDALFHIAFFKNLERAEDRIDYLSDEAIESSEFKELNSVIPIE